MIQILFYLYLLSTLAISSIFGENVERRFCIYLLISCISTHIVQEFFTFPSYLYYIIVIDASILLYSLYLALKRNRFWPIWFSGFLVVGMAASVSILVFRSLNPFIVFAASAFWSLPALACMAYGTHRDGRQRAERNLAISRVVD